MTPAEYAKGVERTLYKDGAVKPPLWAPALGLAGEAGEVRYEIEHGTEEDVKLELGDVLWYVFAAALAEDQSIAELELAATRTCAKDLIHHVALYVDWVKKRTWHSKPFDKAQHLSLLGDILSCCYEVAHDHELAFWDDVAAANIAKLKARYPDGFTTEASR